MNTEKINNLLSQTDYAQKAFDLFHTGLNCSQAVFVAFSDMLELDVITAQKISVGLGGGVGRMREVCGAVSGAAMVLGFLYGGEDGTDKKAAYKKVKEFAEKFKEENRYIVCRELRGLDPNLKETYVPDERTQEYYRARPCAQLVRDATRLVEEMLKEEQ